MTMHLVATKRPPSEKSDLLRFIRQDHSVCEIEMPRQGVLPHDLVHFVVETGLKLSDGFLSMVAQGADAQFVMELTHDTQRRDVERGAMQAEAIVEALQTQLWSGNFDHDAFAYGLQTATGARNIEAPAAPAESLGRALFQQAVGLNAIWSQIKPYEKLELRF